MWRHIGKDNASCGNLGAFTDFHVAENLCACSDQHSPTYLGMPVARRFSGSAKGHFMEEGDVVFNH